MNLFAQLYFNLDQTTRTSEKVEALKRFFTEADAHDRLWALALFTHKSGRKRLSSGLLKTWAIEICGLPVWLFEESYALVGDLAETLSLLVCGKGNGDTTSTLTGWMNEIVALAPLPDEQKKERVSQIWATLDADECLVFNKLLTGGFRIGVSQNLIVRGVAEAFQLDPAQVAHRIMGNWRPESTTFQALILDENQGDDASRPYPFSLAYPLENEEEPGDPSQWVAEWKWDGIRIQTIVRNGELFIWSRGEELITNKFPELGSLPAQLPNGTVIDGELLPVRSGKPLDFQLLQTRITRKNVTPKQLKEAPAAIYAYDLLEESGVDIRHLPFSERRLRLETLVNQSGSQHLLLSPLVPFSDWETLRALRNQARAYRAEGFMLKRKTAPYQAGRKRGDWWKWKIDPMQIDAVLVYAQKGHGRRADLFTDYTFAVWDGDRLVTFAKAYSGLTDLEIRQVDAFVKKNTFEKFGPVRTVKPELVFEIGFEGIQPSSRHKSGVAVRFPRILRWRHDKIAAEADTLAQLQSLLQFYR